MANAPLAKAGAFGRPEGETKAGKREGGSVGLPDARERDTANENADTRHPARAPAETPWPKRPAPSLYPCGVPWPLANTYPSAGSLEAEARTRLQLARAMRPKKRRGRPLTKAVKLAAEMRSAGTPWHAIYPKAIRDYWQLEEFERRVRRENLRRAVKALRKRRGGANPP